MRRLLLWAWGFLLPGIGSGQLTVFNQAEVPENPSENTWHFNTKNTQISRFDGKDWQPVAIKYGRWIKEWNGHVWIKTSDMQALAQANGTVLLNPCHWIIKDEDLITGFVCGHGTLLLNLAGDTLGFVGRKDIRRNAYQADTILGQKTYCVPKYISGMNSMNADLMHNWGMLSTKGEWLIEPRYDAYFRFKDGIASVSYKGKVIQINEKGELID